MPQHNTDRSPRRYLNTIKVKVARITRKTAKRHVAIDRVEREIARLETLIYDYPFFATNRWVWWLDNIDHWKHTRDELLVERDALLSAHYSASQDDGWISD